MEDYDDDEVCDDVLGSIANGKRLYKDIVAKLKTLSKPPNSQMRIPKS